MKEICRTCTFYSKLDKRNGKYDKKRGIIKSTDTCENWDECYKYIGGSMDYNYRFSDSLENCKTCKKRNELFCKVFKLGILEKRVCDECKYYSAIGIKNGICKLIVYNYVDANEWCNSYKEILRQEEDNYFILN